VENGNAEIVWAYTLEGATLIALRHFLGRGADPVDLDQVEIKAADDSWQIPYKFPPTPGIFSGSAEDYVSRLFLLRSEDFAACYSCGMTSFGLEQFEVCSECGVCRECLLEDAATDCPDCLIYLQKHEPA
jgi:hypothetical protein